MVNLIAKVLMWILLLANAAATIRALLFRGNSWGQKIAQTLLIWLVPVIGAGLVFALSHDKSGRSGGVGDGGGGIYSDGIDHAYCSDVGGGDASSGGDGGGHWALRCPLLKK